MRPGVRRFKVWAITVGSYTLGMAAFLGLVTLIGVVASGGWPR